MECSLANASEHHLSRQLAAQARISLGGGGNIEGN
jgi:hypothetical protein